MSLFRPVTGNEAVSLYTYLGAGFEFEDVLANAQVHPAHSWRISSIDEWRKPASRPGRREILACNREIWCH